MIQNVIDINFVSGLFYEMLYYLAKYYEISWNYDYVLFRNIMSLVDIIV